MANTVTRPGRYVEQREARRRTRTLISVGFLALLLLAVGFRSGPVAAALGTVGAIVIVVGVNWLLVLRGRAQPPGEWRAALPVWAASTATTPLRGGLRPEAELQGVLHVEAGNIVWTPTAGARRLGAGTMTWHLTQTQVTRIWGIAPFAHLSGADETGRWVDLWVRDPRDLADRLRAATR